MITLIRRLWWKWKNRKYLKRLKEQSDYYNQLARTLNKAYWETFSMIDLENCRCYIPLDLLEGEIPELQETKDDN